MRIRSLSLAMVIVLATGCSETYDPQPQLASVPARDAAADARIPNCSPNQDHNIDGFTIIVDTLRRNGEVQRSQAYFQQVRNQLGQRLEKLGPDFGNRANPALDKVFAAGEIEKLTLCAFVEFANAQPKFELWEAWSLDPRMREIHAAIVDIDESDHLPSSALAVSEARRAQFLRLSRAVDLPGYRYAMSAMRWQLVAIAEAAIDPASSLKQDLAMNPSDLGIPPEQVFVDHFLAGALESASDVELQRFLEFAESREGQAYYQTLRGRYMPANSLAERLSVALKSSAVPKTIEEDPAEADRLLAEARHLLDQVGTRVVFPDARTMLVRAERLDPDNAEIQVLLGRVAFFSLPPTFQEDEGQLRPVIDDSNPASPERYADIEKHLRRALEIDPKNAEALLYLGRVQFLLSKDDEAAKLYAQSRQLDPKGPALALFEADLAYVGGDYARAERVHRQILAAPEVRAFDHHYSLERLRHVLAKQGREREFRRIGNEQLKRHPDMWDFRLQQAYRLIATDGTVAEIESLVSPVPDHWLPEAKRVVLVRLQLLRAGQAVPAQRTSDVQRAFELAETSTEVVEAACDSRVRGLVAADVVAASDEPKAASDRLLACGISSGDHAFIEQILPMVKDIDQPNASMNGEPPLCGAVGTMDPIVFGALLKAKPDVAKRCGNSKTVREALSELATGRYADPSSRKAANDMLELLDRHDHGR